MVLGDLPCHALPVLSGFPCISRHETRYLCPHAAVEVLTLWDVSLSNKVNIAFFIYKINENIQVKNSNPFLNVFNNFEVLLPHNNYFWNLYVQLYFSYELLWRFWLLLQYKTTSDLQSFSNLKISNLQAWQFVKWDPLHDECHFNANTEKQMWCSCWKSWHCCQGRSSSSSLISGRRHWQQSIKPQDPTQAQ